jgi:Amt family ammonium transporter
MVIEWIHRGKPTALGVASGLVAGLVAITPASGFVAPWAALVLGLLAGLVCYGGVLLKNKFGYDDTLDAFGVHGVGGFAGAILTGVFAQKAMNDAGADGALFGNPHQLVVQTIGLRVSEQEEGEGVDITQHGEEAYGETMGGLSNHMEKTEDAKPIVALHQPATAE